MCCGLEKQSQVRLKIAVGGKLGANSRRVPRGAKRCEDCNTLKADKCLTQFYLCEIHCGQDEDGRIWSLVYLLFTV